MNDVLQIKAAYDWMIETYQKQVSAAASSNDQPSIDRLDAYRDSLERGIFVVLFGQFEVELNARFEARRDVKSSNSDWKVRRGWDAPQLLVAKVGRVPFETRLALMCSEHEPLTCHRCLLVGRRLVERGVAVAHILRTGEIETNEATEERLLKLTRQSAPDLMATRQDRLAAAYRVQGLKITRKAK